jgi:hypothetical protein
MIPLLPDVFRFFASDPIEPLLSLPRIADDDTHPLSRALHEQLDLLPREVVDAVRNDPLVRFDAEHLSDQSLDGKARLWALIQILNVEIPRARLMALSSQHSSQRPPPYDHDALSDLRLSQEFLVPLNAFVREGGALLRNGYAFTVVPPVQSVNSQWWLLQILNRSSYRDRAWVRLDPFLVRPEGEFARMEYRMWWWGRPLDWKRLAQLKYEEHGRWAPSSLSTRSEFTDFVWKARNGEVHFECEELPKMDECTERGSRYFHGVYISEGYWSHIDGGIRIYNGNEWDARSRAHLRHHGKVGTRTKVFRLDSDLERDTIAAICPSFFVWNHDVARYFGADMPENL